MHEENKQNQQFDSIYKGMTNPPKKPIETMVDAVLKPVENPTKSESGLPHVTHEGILQIGEVKLRCYLLSNGMRIFNAEDIDNFFKDFNVMEPK